MRRLFAIERLAEAAPSAAPRPGRGIARLLFAPEPLARAPEAPPRRRRSWLRLLFAIEPLPRAPAFPPRARRARWLRWIFAPERLAPLDPP